MAEPRVDPPEAFSEEAWHQMYGVARSALERDCLDDVDVEAQLGGFEEFQYYHLHPQERVGETDNFNQEYHHARVAALYEGGEITAWGSSEHNVSEGNPRGPQDDSLKMEALRTLKRMSGAIPISPIHALGHVVKLNKNYFHIREAYSARPGEGRGKAIARGLGSTAIPGQPWGVYVIRGIYKPESSSLETGLIRRGFYITDDDLQKRIGDQIYTMVRMQRDHMFNGSRVFR